MSKEYQLARTVHTALAAVDAIKPHLLEEILNPADQVNKLEQAAKAQDTVVAVAVQPPELVPPTSNGFPTPGMARANVTVQVYCKRELTEDAHEACCTLQDAAISALVAAFTDTEDGYCPELVDVADIDAAGTAIPADVVGRQITIQTVIFYT